MAIINYKKPAGVKGADGADGQSWSSVDLSPGDANCPYGGIKFMLGNEAKYICKPAPTIQPLIPICTNKEITTSVFPEVLNIFTIPVLKNSTINLKMIFNKMPGAISAINSDVVLLAKFNGDIKINNEIMLLSDIYKEYTFSVLSGNSETLNIEVYGKNTDASRKNILTSVFLQII